MCGARMHKNGLTIFYDKFGRTTPNKKCVARIQYQNVA